MADTLNKKQLENLPVSKYDFVRDQLMTGDIFFSSGSYRFSRIIQKLTKSVWSHVAIIYRDVELKRIMVLEGQVVVAKLNFGLPHENMNSAISFGLDALSRPYDNWEIIRIFLRIIFRIGKREKNRNYICSELVRDANRVEFRYRIL